MTGAAEFPVHDRLPDRQLTGVGTGGFVRRGPVSLVDGWARAWAVVEGLGLSAARIAPARRRASNPRRLPGEDGARARLPRGICGPAPQASWHPAHALEPRAAATRAGPNRCSTTTPGPGGH